MCVPMISPFGCNLNENGNTQNTRDISNNGRKLYVKFFGPSIRGSDWFDLELFILLFIGLERNAFETRSIWWLIHKWTGKFCPTRKWFEMEAHLFISKLGKHIEGFCIKTFNKNRPWNGFFYGICSPCSIAIKYIVDVENWYEVDFEWLWNTSVNFIMIWQMNKKIME